MSSFTRRIQRQLSPSQAVHAKLDEEGVPTGELYANPARKKFFEGRGQRLGVTNPKGKELVARLLRERQRRAA
jgi:hypothetical protein